MPPQFLVICQLSAYTMRSGMTKDRTSFWGRVQDRTRADQLFESIFLLPLLQKRLYFWLHWLPAIFVIAEAVNEVCELVDQFLLRSLDQEGICWGRHRKSPRVMH